MHWRSYRLENNWRWMCHNAVCPVGRDRKITQHCTDTFIMVLLSNSVDWNEHQPMNTRSVTTPVRLHGVVPNWTTGTTLRLPPFTNYLSVNIWKWIRRCRISGFSFQVSRFGFLRLWPPNQQNIMRDKIDRYQYEENVCIRILGKCIGNLNTVSLHVLRLAY